LWNDFFEIKIEKYLLICFIYNILMNQLNSNNLINPVILNSEKKVENYFQETINIILSVLPQVKSAWELLYNLNSHEKNKWIELHGNLIHLFRKDSFYSLIGHESYYPQPKPNCRYYIKPNDGSCGKGIQIVNVKPIEPVESCVVCPEIITPLITKSDGFQYKYDFRVWVGITGDLEFYVCPTLILRVSTIPFNINDSAGSLTNTSLYSEQFNCQDENVYNKICPIVAHVLGKLPRIKANKQAMLTGWDFIVGESGDVYVLEVNCSPGINILHSDVMTEYLNWLGKL